MHYAYPWPGLKDYVGLSPTKNSSLVATTLWPVYRGSGKSCCHRTSRDPVAYARSAHSITPSPLSPNSFYL